MVDQLVTTAQVKTRLGISDPSDDTLISSLIDGLSAFVATKTKRKFAPEVAATYLFDTQAGSIVYVRRGIRSVTSIGYATSDQPETAGTYTAIATTAVVLRPSAAERYDGWPPDQVLITGSAPIFRNAINGCTITGNFGFASVPTDLQEVAIEAVVSAYSLRGKPAAATIGSGSRAVFPWATLFTPDTGPGNVLAFYRGIAESFG